MGSFWGHVLDGLCFIIMSSWWTVNIMRSMYKSQLCKNASPWKTQFYFVGPSCAKNFPIEPTLKIVLGTISLLAEVVTGMEDGKFTALNNAHHITMASFFILSGITDYLKQYRQPLPDQIEGAMLALAFGVQAFMFQNHQHGTSPFEMLVHRFVIYVTAATSACIAYECIAVAGPLSSLIRTLLVMMQGTWLIQIGFMLYPPFSWLQPWDASHESLMLAPAIFAWHGIVVILVMAAIGLVVSRIVRASNNSLQVNYSVLVQDD